MKILISHDNIELSQKLGLAKGFLALGHEVFLWDTTKESAFNAFDNCEPDLFITQNRVLDRAILKCVNERPALKIALELQEKRSQYFQELVSNTYFPILFFYNGNFNENSVLSDIQVKKILPAADIFTWHNGKKIPQYQSDLCAVGNINNKSFLQLCSTFKYNIKIFGTENRLPQYMGNIPIEKLKDVTKSAKCCFHYQVGETIDESLFGLALNKCLIITETNERIKDIFGNNVLYFNNTLELSLNLDSIKQYGNKYEELINKNYELVSKQHTYLNRAIEFLEFIGEKKEWTEILAKIKKQYC